MRKRLYIQTSLATTHCHVCSSSFFKTRQPRAVDVINRSNRSASCASSCSAAHTVPLGVCVRPWTENYAQSDAHTHTPRVDQGVIKHSRISTIERTLGDLSHLPRVLARGSGTSVQWWRTAKMMCAAPRGVAYTAPVDLLFELSDLAGARSVGSGTSAVVYAGAWRGLEVAVKVLRGGLCARAEQEAERERSAHARLRHPNIIAFLGSAGVPGGAHALVFQYCQGGSLDVRKLAQAADLAVAIDVALDVARALEHAHTRNVIHRDVKPSQVFLDCCGRALLGDWGLAATVGSAECTVSETGTWEYMAPEVVDCVQPYGPPADVFSFGVLLWCLMAGETYPYEAEYITPEQAAHAVARGDLRPRRLTRLVENAPKIDDLIHLCLAQDPRERPPMRNVLDSLLLIRDDIEQRRVVAPQRHGWGTWLWNP